MTQLELDVLNLKTQNHALITVLTCILAQFDKQGSGKELRQLIGDLSSKIERNLTEIELPEDAKHVFRDTINRLT